MNNSKCRCCKQWATTIIPITSKNIVPQHTSKNTSDDHIPKMKGKGIFKLKYNDELGYYIKYNVIVKSRVHIVGSIHAGGPHVNGSLLYKLSFGIAKHIRTNNASTSNKTSKQISNETTSSISNQTSSISNQTSSIVNQIKKSSINNIFQSKGIWSKYSHQPLTSSIINLFKKGELYISVNTNAYPEGQIRGQLDCKTNISNNIIYTNGKFVTMDSEQRIASAVVTSNGKISNVLYNNNDIVKYIQHHSSYQIIDMGGKTVLPGFVMSHSHVGIYSSLSRKMTVSPMNLFFRDDYITPQTSSEVLDTIRTYLKDYNEDTFITQGYDPMLQSGPIISRRDLDSISTSIGIYIISASMHNIYVNTRSLISAGLIDNIDDSWEHIMFNDKVPLDAREQFELGSISEDNMKYISHAMPAPSMNDMIISLNMGSKILNAQGITTIGDALVADLTMNVYHEFSRLCPNIRIVMFPFYEKDSSMFSSHHGAYDRFDIKQYYNNDHLYVGPVKVVVDGSIQGYTSCTSMPYKSEPFFKLHSDEIWKGEIEYTVDQLRRIFEVILRNNYRIAVHGNGDRAIETILDAFEAAHQKYPVDDHRTRIEHCTMVRPDQLTRIKALNIHPSYLTNHVYYYGDVFYDKVLGPARANHIDPLKWTLDAGILCDAHSDSPVTPPSPLFQIWVQCTRYTSSGRVLGAEQKISIYDSLKMFTINAAYSLGIDAYVGSLEVGKFADMVVLSDDILSVDIESIRDIKIVNTYIGGRLIHND